jgi:pSer/pThr/pTyr-binding forkhead associated (FHA) protein
MPEIVVKLGDNVVHRYFFDKDILSIGRARDNDIVIENLSVSRNHARIRRQDGKYILTDLNSANGTYVNGVKITKTEVVDDDVITIGKHKIHFIDKQLSDEQIIADAFGADRTMIVDKTPSAILIVTKGKQKDQEFKITKFETTIGRANDNDICVHDWFVSKKHAVIMRQGPNFFVKDLGSWKGTYVNGKYVKDASLNDGDTLQLGTTYLSFKVSTEEELMEISGRVPKELAVEEGVEAVNTPEEAVYEEASLAVVETSVPPSDEAALEEFEPAFERLEADEIEQPYPDPVAPSPAVETPPSPKRARREKTPPPAEQPPADQLAAEIALWETALKNKSLVVRREAARMLRKLTGKDYPYD